MLYLLLLFAILVCRDSEAGTAVVQQAKVGGSNGCALIAEARRIKCWGSNKYGVLGTGNSSDVFGNEPGEMGDDLPFVNLGTGMDGMIESFSMGGFHICAVSTEGKLKCWGVGEFGGLGLEDVNGRGDDPDEMGDNLPFVQIGTGRTVLSVSCGTLSTCVVMDTRQIKCWGSDYEGSIGSTSPENGLVGAAPGEMGDNLLPVALPTGSLVKQVSCANIHTCVVLVDGDVYCFGAGLAIGLPGYESANPYELGNSLPKVDLGGNAVDKIYTGMDWTCALFVDGKVRCFGVNSNGVLGTGTTSDVGLNTTDMGSNLTAITLDTGRTVLSIGLSETGVCAVLDDHSLVCWGDGVTSPSLPYGFGDRTYKILSVEGAGALTNEYTLSTWCATWDDTPYPSMMCWGGGTNGSLGVGSDVDYPMIAGEAGDSNLPANVDLYTLPTSSPTPPTPLPTLSPTRSPEIPTVAPTQTPTLLPTQASSSPTLAPSNDAIRIAFSNGILAILTACIVIMII